MSNFYWVQIQLLVYNPNKLKAKAGKWGRSKLFTRYSTVDLANKLQGKLQCKLVHNFTTWTSTLCWHSIYTTIATGVPTHETKMHWTQLYLCTCSLKIGHMSYGIFYCNSSILRPPKIFTIPPETPCIYIHIRYINVKSKI